MKYWWVNQGKTYAFEVGQNFMWSPLAKADGKLHNSYENMPKMQPGDLVFSHVKNFIRAIGIVQSKAFISPQPNFEGSGSASWADSGWQCDVAFTELDSPLDYRIHLNQIRPLLPSKFSPLDKNGNAVLSYLFEISQQLGEYLLTLTDFDLTKLEMYLAQAIYDSEEELDLEAEKEIIQKENLGPLEKINLVKSRRGQGTFKTNVRMFEKQCRVTGLSDQDHLIASHIKPWRDSDNREKIDGHNGLLLSPYRPLV